jgi:hypothetical protein
VRARVLLRSGIPVDHLEIIENGKVVASLRQVIDTIVTLPVEHNSWFVARAYSDKPRLPVLDLYPFASTSPIYVKVDNAPTTCREDSEYFLKWIDLVSERARGDTNWNSTQERERTLTAISRAHAEFIRRR